MPASCPLATLLLIVAMLCGCATPQVGALLADRPQGLPARAEIADAPFYPQDVYQCGPAALATVLAHGGAQVTPEQLAAAVYLPAREGTLQAEMLAGTRREGHVAYLLAPRIEDVLREVAAGTPVVVLQNLAFEFAPVWHYAVVVGYDVESQEIVLRSGTTRRLVMTFSSFERTWARGGHWAMVAMPPERIPVTASEERYVDAVVALERSSVAGARMAYSAALSRWPHNFTAMMGAGNTAYAMKDFEAADVAYRRAAARRPESADAWNNLAHALAKRGKTEEARNAATRAVMLGGPRVATYQATLRAISRESE